MSSDNPTYTVANAITDVEARLGTPGISSSIYVPWASYAYNRVWGRLAKLGQHVKENLFGDTDTISLTQSTLEHDISDSIPRFESAVEIEVLYGGANDVRTRATKLRSVSHWGDLSKVSTDYRSKSEPLYYILGGKLGVIPVPPESGAVAYVKFIKRGTQLTDPSDEIDLPYRFIYPIIEYMHAKAIQRTNEDYSTSRNIENEFKSLLDEIEEVAASEFSEDDETNAVEVSASSSLFSNPFRR